MDERQRGLFVDGEESEDGEVRATRREVEAGDGALLIVGSGVGSHLPFQASH